MPSPLNEPARRALSDWAEHRRRDLPWRATRDPWAVLVSELMLQQTQVSRVLPRYPGFMAQFPTPSACAEAGRAEIVRAWSGLGYNRRAVNLHRCAVQVTERWGGRFPADLGELLGLPGVGPYTARAVLAFAFEVDVGIVDTNAARVLARAAGSTLTSAQAQEMADGSVPSGRAWSWNQGVLDLGAMVCTKRNPRCGECPIAHWCAWGGGPDGRDDPAVGSAGVPGRQSRFEGSDRQGRGRLIEALRTGGVIDRRALGQVAGWPADQPRAERVAESLVRDGLAVWHDSGLDLRH